MQGSFQKALKATMEIVCMQSSRYDSGAISNSRSLPCVPGWVQGASGPDLHEHPFALPADHSCIAGRAGWGPSETNHNKSIEPGLKEHIHVSELPSSINSSTLSTLSIHASCLAIRVLDLTHFPAALNQSTAHRGQAAYDTKSMQLTTPCLVSRGAEKNGDLPNIAGLRVDGGEELGESKGSSIDWHCVQRTGGQCHVG